MIDQAQIEEIEELGRDLGPFGLQWLCACALSPGLRFATSVHLGARLAEIAGRPVPDVEEHRALFQLEWFRLGAIPEGARGELMRRLDSRFVGPMRAELAALLDESDARPDRRHSSTATLPARDLPAGDPVLMAFVTGAPLAGTGLRWWGKFRRWLARRRPPWRWLAVALLSAAIVVLGASMLLPAIFKRTVTEQLSRSVPVQRMMAGRVPGPPPVMPTASPQPSPTPSASPTAVPAGLQAVISNGVDPTPSPSPIGKPSLPVLLAPPPPREGGETWMPLIHVDSLNPIRPRDQQPGALKSRLEYSTDGSRIIFQRGLRNISVIDANNGRIIRDEVFNSNEFPIASHDGWSTIIVSERGTINNKEVSGPPYLVGMSIDDRIILIASSDKNIYAISNPGFLPLWKIEQSEAVDLMTFSRDGNALIVSGERLDVRQASTGRLISSNTNSKDHVESAAFSPDGSEYWIGTDKWVWGFHTLPSDTGTLGWVIDEPVVGVAFSPDGYRNVALSTKAMIGPYHRGRDGLLATLPAAGGKGAAIAFSPSGMRLAIGSAEASVEIWGLAAAQATPPPSPR